MLPILCIMSENLENLHKNICNKINTIYKIQKQLNMSTININVTRKNYLMSVIDIFNNYSSNYNNTDKLYHYTLEFKKRLKSINVLNKINNEFAKLSDFIYSNDIDNKEIYIELINYKNNNNLIILVDDDNKEIIVFCDCKVTNKININKYEYICPECGKIYINSTNTSNSNNSTDKQTKYDFLRHYRIWLDKILAVNDSYLKKHIDKIILIEKKIKEDYTLEQQRKKLNISTIRKYLKSFNLTKLNDLAPLILKKITNVQCPQLTSKEYIDLENLFIQVMKIYDSVKKGNVNRKYYPYFIYKIIEFYFKGNPEKQKILSQIYLQKKKTLVNNDLIWKQMCDNLQNGLMYKETIPKF